MSGSKPLGFTLIEILIVIFIVSLVSGVAMLTIGTSDSRRFSTLASELQQELTLAEQQAILRPAILRLVFNREGYQFFYYQPAQDEKAAAWIPLNDTLLSKHRLPSDVSVRVRLHLADAITDNDNVEHSAIIISTSGNLTPFTILIGKPNEPAMYALHGDEDGNVIQQELTH